MSMRAPGAGRGAPPAGTDRPERAAPVSALAATVQALTNKPGGLSWAEWTGLGSLAIAATVASTTVRKAWAEWRTSRRDELVRETGADVARESVALGSSERAVLVLDKALATMQAQADRDAAEHAADLDSYRRELQALRTAHIVETKDLRESLRTARAAYERAARMHEQCTERIVVRDEVIRELNDRVTVLAHDLGAAAPKRLVVHHDSDELLEVETAEEEAEINACPSTSEDMAESTAEERTGDAGNTD